MAGDRRLIRSKKRSSKEHPDECYSPPEKKQKSNENKEKKSRQSKMRKPHACDNIKDKTTNGGKNIAEPTLPQEERKTLYKVKREESFNIKTRSDTRQCLVLSMCLLDSGDLLISDEMNPVLKQVDGHTYKIQHTLKLCTTSHSVCKVNETEAIVALSNNCIQFVSTQKNLVATRSLQMDHGCFGICVIADKIYITDGSNSNIFIYDLDGNCLNKTGGEDIFSWNRYIVESDDGNAIYVTDKENGLIKMNTDSGEVIWKSHENPLTDAFGLCTDGLGNILVSGFVPRKLVQIRSDGQCLGEIISSGIPETSGLCFDKQKSKLFVSKHSCNKILVYYLK